MAVLDENFGTDLTPVEGKGGIRSCPQSVSHRTPRDLRSPCERERVPTRDLTLDSDVFIMRCRPSVQPFRRSRS